MDVSAIRVLGRTTQGSLVQNLAEGDVVVAISTTNGKKLDDSEGQEPEDESALNEETIGSQAEIDGLANSQLPAVEE